MLGTVPTIDYIQPDRRHVAVCPLVPEFQFTEPKGHTMPPMYRDVWANSEPRPIGPIPSHPSLAPKPERKRRLLGEAAQAHHDFKPFFKHEVQTRTRAPMGTTKPYLPESFVTREAEYNFLVSTQFLELPTAQQELGAISLSSSRDDDDDDALFEVRADLTEHNACRYGTAYEYNPATPEYSAMAQRIEWEQYILACGQANKVFAKKNAEGQRVLSATDVRIRGDALLAFKDKVLGLVGDRTLDELENDRARARYFKKIVWAQMTPAEQMAWMQRTPDVQAYLDPIGNTPTIELWDGNLVRELHEDPDTKDAFITDDPLPAPPASGPQELGLHNIHPKRQTADYEPSDGRLEYWSSLA